MLEKPSHGSRQAASQAVVETFVDALWLEEGLSRNTLDAYRRDLTLLGTWLGGQGKNVLQANEADLNGYFAHRHSQTRATTANRRLTVFKRFFRWALRERQIGVDPTVRMQAARQPLRVVLDRQLRMPAQARILQGEPILIAHGATATGTRPDLLRAVWCDVVSVCVCGLCVSVSQCVCVCGSQSVCVGVHA